MPKAELCQPRSRVAHRGKHRCRSPSRPPVHPADARPCHGQPIVPAVGAIAQYPMDGLRSAVCHFERVRSGGRSGRSTRIQARGRRPEAQVSRSPYSGPSAAATTSGMTHMPAFTSPAFRPDAPKPRSIASNNTTSAPPSARCSAVDTPVNPPPMTATSVFTDPSNAAVSGGGGAVTCHSPCEPAQRCMPGVNSSRSPILDRRRND